MGVEFKIPNTIEAELRLDNLFAEAFGSDHPAMQDWVAIKFNLVELRRKISDNSEVQKPAHNTDYMAALVKIKKIVHGRGDTVTKVGKVSDLIASLNFPKAENCT